MTLDDLRTLEKLATPPRRCGAARIGDYGPPEGIQFATVCQDDQKVAEFYEQADADFYVALRNAAPALIACAESLYDVRDHAEFDDGQGNNDASVLRGRLATIRDSIREALRRLEGVK